MRDNQVDFSTTFPRALVALEAAVQELLSSGDWEESARRRAHDMAVALTLAAKDAHRWETERILRPVACLLALSPREVLPIRGEVRGKLLELLSLLKKLPASRSA